MSYTPETGITGMTYSSQQNYIYGDANWKDKLTAVDGSVITYDAIGNPISYNGYTFTWEQGRQLKQASKSGTNLSYSYDENGLRVSKIYNGTTYNYTWVDNQLTHQAWNNNYIHFYYDGDSIIGFNYNGTSYTYVKNIQGDVIGIVDNSGTLITEYEYDAWGKLLSATGSMANINPIRYRGYYYDSEIGMYYLQSRYYDPSLRRFLNQDEPTILFLSQAQFFNVNLFSYCKNNPVAYKDFSGYSISRLEDDPAAYDAYYSSHWNAMQKMAKSYLQKESWLFALASCFGINITAVNETVSKTFFYLDLWLIKLSFSVTVGLTYNYEAGISFNYSKDNIGISCNLGLGSGYSLAFSYTLGWTKISRSMSLVYAQNNEGRFVSLDVEFEINHLITGAVAVACAYWPSLSPVLWQMVAKSNASAVSAMSLLVPVIRFAYSI